MSLCLNSRYLALDVTFHVYNFLSYKESTILQKSSKQLNFHQSKMDKYSHHEQPHGKIETYHKITKNKILEKNYNEGKEDGIQKEWYENGQLKYERNFKEGKKDGIQKEWYENEQLFYEGNYKKGEFEGKQKMWDEDGQLKLEENYYTGDDPSLQGKKDGIQIWDEDGCLFEEIYKNGQKMRTKG